MFKNIEGKNKLTVKFTVPPILKYRVNGASTRLLFNVIKDKNPINWVHSKIVEMDAQLNLDMSEPTLNIPLLNVKHRGNGTIKLECTKTQDPGNIIKSLSIASSKKESINKISITDDGEYTLKVKLAGEPSDWVNKTAKIKLTLNPANKVETNTGKTVSELIVQGYTPQILKLNSSKLKVDKNNGVALLPLITMRETKSGLKFPCEIKLKPADVLIDPADGVILLQPGQPLPRLKFNLEKLNKLEKLNMQISTGDKNATRFLPFKQTVQTSTVTLPLDYSNFSSQFKLTVNGGNGSGDYKANTIVQFKANIPPKGKVFNKWTGDIGNLDRSVYSASNAIKMPDQNVKLTAAYKIKAIPPPPPIECSADFSCKQKPEEIIVGEEIKFKNQILDTLF